jgi:hypothetical protein
VDECKPLITGGETYKLRAEAGPCTRIIPLYTPYTPPTYPLYTSYYLPYITPAVDGVGLAHHRVAAAQVEIESNV